MSRLRLTASSMLLALLACSASSTAQEKASPEKGIDAATVAAYAKIGGSYGGWLKPGDIMKPGKDSAEKGRPGFFFVAPPKGKLPDVAVPFGLSLHGAGFTDATLKDLLHLKNLDTLVLQNTKVTDAGLKDVVRLTSLRRLSLYAAKITDEGLKELASLDQLTELDLLLTDVTDAGLPHLKPFKNLTYLRLSDVSKPAGDAGLRTLREMGLLHALNKAGGKDGSRPKAPEEVISFDLYFSHPKFTSKVTDAGLKELAHFTNLERLNLESTQVTAAGLRELTPFKNLTWLNLANTKVAGAALKDLTRFKKLQTVLLHSRALPTQVTDADLNALGEVGLLHTLAGAQTTEMLGKSDDSQPRPRSADEVVAFSLRQSDKTGHAVTDAGLKELAVFKNLVALDLAYTSVTDAGMKHLAVFNLKKLDLSFTQVTDVGMKELARHKNLTHVELTGAPLVTLEGLVDLRKALPDCTFSYAKGIDNATMLAYYRNGGKYGGYSMTFTGFTFKEGKEVAAAGLPGFTFEPAPKGKLPPVAGAFGLSLLGPTVTDATLKDIAHLKNLTVLYLTQTEATDVGIKELAGLRSLERLYIHAHMTDEGLKELAPLEKLIELDLMFTKVTDAGLLHLAPFKSLNTLTLNDNLHKPTDATLANLSKVGLLHALVHARGRDGARPRSPVEVFSFGQAYSSVKNLTDAGVKELATFTNLERLDLPESKVTGAGLRALAGCQNITRLNLKFTRVSGPALKELAPFKKLDTLFLHGDLTETMVRDDDLKALREIGLLHALYGARVTDDLFHTSKGAERRPRSAEEVIGLSLRFHEQRAQAGVSDAGLKELAPFKNLAALDLQGTKVTDAGLKELARFNLTRLNLNITTVGDGAIKDLAPFKKLHTLMLGDTKLTDAGLKELATTCPSLVRLDIGHSPFITDAGLKELAPLKNLAELHIYFNTRKVTAAGVAELQKALPKCRIFR